MTNRIYSGPWVIGPIVLSVVFAALFFPVARRTQEFSLSLVYTLIGVAVIWVSYMVRARILAKWDRDRRNGRRPR